VQAAIILVCDQPFVTTKLLESLVAKYQETGKPIVASWYQNSMGTPALFDTTIFALLLALKGDTGAKKIMTQNPDWVSTVDFPLGEIDIDTMEDYGRICPAPRRKNEGRQDEVG
jgi:molybdenum cofactor cytidylyltransferase